MPLSYPVDTEKLYDIYDTAAALVVKERIRWPRSDGMEIRGLDANLVPLLHVRKSTPQPDPIRQRAGDWGEPIIDLEAGTATYSREVTDLSLEEVKERKGWELKETREEMLAGGFTFNGKHYQTRNDADRINIMGVGTAAQAALAAGVPFNVNFRATDNTTVAMDAATGAAFYQTMIGAAQVIWDAYNTADATLQAATTAQEAAEVTL